MQSQEPDQRAAGALNHPDESEWMAYLYREMPAKRKSELTAHLAACPACQSQMNAWQTAMNALDDWKISTRRKSTSRAWVPALRWAAAAAVVLVVGFGMGRHSTSQADELASLKSSVSRLSELVQAQSDSSVGLSNRVAASSMTTDAQVAHVLSEYTRLLEEQRVADRDMLAVALRSFNARLNKVHDDIVTVAADTEDGLEQAHQNITRIASVSLDSKKPTN